MKLFIEANHNYFYNLPKPFAFLNLDAFDRNFDLLMQKTAGKSVRVATKSIRSVGILKRLQQKGIERFMCFTLDEAIYLAQQGFDNLMVAYPTTQMAYMSQLAEQLKQGKTIYLTVDNQFHLQQLNSYAKQYNVTIPISMDVDVSMDFMGIHFGVYRSSLHTKESIEQFLKQLENYKHLQLKGVMTYDAQIAGVADSRPGNLLNPILKFLKKKSLPKVQQQRKEIMQLIHKFEIQLDYFNAGGTGSVELVAQDENVTEVTFGSGLYQSTYFDGYSNLKNEPSAGYVMELCRNPNKNVYTILGGGYIASGEIGTEKQPTLVYPEGAKLTKNEGCGEVQTPFFTEKELNLSSINYAIFRHAKAGELCERFKTLQLFANGKHIGETTTYRGDSKCFL